MSGFGHALAVLPSGTFTGTANDIRYIVTKTVLGQGRTTKLVAEELGGSDYISLNYFDLSSGARLKPCEMPVQKVVDFVLALQPTSAQDPFILPSKLRGAAGGGSAPSTETPQPKPQKSTSTP